MLLERVKELANQKKMTIAELERKLDFAQGSISKWNKQSPSSERLAKVAEFFDVSTDYLLGLVQKSAPKETDLNKLIEDVNSFDGEPMTDNDKEMILAYLKGKYGK